MSLSRNTGTPTGADAHRLRGDVKRALIAVVAAILAAAVVLLPPGPAGAAGIAAGLGLVAAQAGALWWIDRLTWPVFAVVVAASAGLRLLYPEVGSGGALAALFAVASLRRPRESLWGLAVAAGFAPAVAYASGWRDGLITGAAALLAWTLGELNRLRAQRRRDLARFAAAAERERIARDLHDVVAHHVSVVVVQAAAADDVFDERPERARAAIRAIESTGRQALAELRRVVRAEPGTDLPPGLSELDDLADSLRAAGLRVVLRRDAVGDVPAEVGLAAHRIVQESLTNVVRHAGATRVDITVTRSGSTVRVEVRDDGAGGASGIGRGIEGMRRRAAELGGSLTAERVETGFLVLAELPCEAI